MIFRKKKSEIKKYPFGWSCTFVQSYKNTIFCLNNVVVRTLISAPTSFFKQPPIFLGQSVRAYIGKLHCYQLGKITLMTVLLLTEMPTSFVFSFPKYLSHLPVTMNTLYITILCALVCLASAGLVLDRRDDSVRLMYFKGFSYKMKVIFYLWKKYWWHA